MEHTTFEEIDCKLPKIYKDLKYRTIYFLSDSDIESKILEFLKKKSFNIYLDQVVTVQLDDYDDILSLSYVERGYLGPDKLYYFYDTIGVMDSNIQIQMYEVTKDYLCLMNKYPEFIGEAKYLGLILKKENNNLITNLNLNFCDTPYAEGRVWYDNFDCSELVIECIEN
jgi:hypothetical protein